jgi:hypothetical protein
MTQWIRKRLNPADRRVGACLVGLAAVAGAVIAGSAFGATRVAPSPGFRFSQTVVRLDGRPVLKLNSVEILGEPRGQAVVSCRCSRPRGPKPQVSYPARDATVYTGVDWLLPTGSRVFVRIMPLLNRPGFLGGPIL